MKRERADHRSCHHRRRRAAALSLSLGLGAALGAGAARADVQPILVGNDAMLSGGAVLASVKDAGAAWYNPAGLAFVQQNSVEISAKAFLVRIYGSGVHY